METWEAETIVKDALVALDEHGGVEASALSESSDGEVLELRSVLLSKVGDAINSVRKTAPAYRLEPEDSTPAVLWTRLGNSYVGSIELPEKFLRFLSFKMSDWARPVNVAITPSDSRYEQQWSEWAGVRGNPSRPVVALNDRRLEFFSCLSEESDVEYLRCVEAVVGATAYTDNYEIETSLYRAVVLRTAALAASAYSDAAKVQLLDALVASELG